MSDPAPHPRAYLRDGVPGLPIEQQEAMLKAAGVDLAGAYIDRLNKAQVKRREPDSLTDRAQMLRPTARKMAEVIYVAGLRVLGWTMADTSRSLAAAGRRSASVHAVDTGKTFTAATLDAELLEALADAEDAHRRGRTEAARSAGVQAAAAMRERKRRTKLEKARAEWVKPPGEVSAADIAAAVGISVRSLHKPLRPRAEAREKVGRRRPHV
jgi:hypothetical protein